MSRLVTSPTWISPMRTANFILIFRIGTDGLIIPAGSTTEPEADIIIVSPETAAVCCPWPGGGCRSESDIEPGIATGLSLVISTGRLQRIVVRSLLAIYLITALEHQEETKDEKHSRSPGKQKQNTQKKSPSVTEIHSGEFRWVGSLGCRCQPVNCADWPALGAQSCVYCQCVPLSSWLRVSVSVLLSTPCCRPLPAAPLTTPALAAMMELDVEAHRGHEGGLPGGVHLTAGNSPAQDCGRSKVL